MIWLKAKLTDEQLWEKVKDSNYHVRYRALDKITNQSLLEKIALEERNCVLRREAVKKITNQSILEKVALEETFWATRYVAIKKLNNVELLKQIALEAKKNGMNDLVTLVMNRLIELGVI